MFYWSPVWTYVRDCFFGDNASRIWHFTQSNLSVPIYSIWERFFNPSSSWYFRSSLDCIFSGTKHDLKIDCLFLKPVFKKLEIIYSERKKKSKLFLKKAYGCLLSLVAGATAEKGRWIHEYNSPAIVAQWTILPQCA